MAESSLLNTPQYDCSVCLDLMKDPVTIPCGHCYCMSCITDYWDRDQFSRTRCPQCRREFPTRPELHKNTMLAEILDQLKNISIPDSPPAQCPAAQPGDIECDLCTKQKVRAVRSCLECRASYCELHLQPHYDVPALRKHKLVVATDIPICPRHDKVLEAFCRTDNMCICVSCLLEEHKGHDTISSAGEREEKQAKLQVDKTTIVEKRKEKESKVQEVLKAADAHARTTEQSIEDAKLALSLLVSSLETSFSEMMERTRIEEDIYQAQYADVREQLENEISILMEQEAAVDKLLKTEDNIYFLQNFDSMPSPPAAEESTCIDEEPSVSCSDVGNMLFEFKAKLEVFCKEELDNMFSKFHIRVGDRVRVKPSVASPKYNWGCTVTHRSVGVVKSLDKEIVIVDFPEHTNWKGLLSEMERVKVADEPAQQRRFKVGDRVRVMPSVTSPKRSWGKVTYQSVGVIKSLVGEEMTVDFPEHSGWIGVVSEMETVP
ncbi:hypothetical protein C0J50_3393 [Silurus asotus]|uniref:Uncharacterized protein n=1 Tax=Silurus asotus TaxID=30991 RepID=A0AAD5AEV9_SILAS|nr:hypothetical protein C0J50_3393 [Silurus asotus]